MRKIFYIFSMLCFMLTCQATETQSYVLATSSNKQDANELLVYNPEGKLLQSLPTKGKGGIPTNTTAAALAWMDPWIAIVNYNSQSVTLFKRQEGSFVLSQVLPTLSKPISVAFGHQHLYILGTTTIESHLVKGDSIEEIPDGSSRLLIADGSAAQVGVLTNQLIISEKSHTIEIVDLKGGAVTTKIDSVELPPAPNNDTPVGLVTRGDIAYVTIAHSDKVGIVKDKKLIALVSSESQHAPCWLALTGSWLYASNTPSQTISRYKVSDSSIILEEAIAARTPAGLPSDIDIQNGILAVLDTTGKGPGYIDQFQIDAAGKLNLIKTFSTAEKANGMLIIPNTSP